MVLLFRIRVEGTCEGYMDGSRLLGVSVKSELCFGCAACAT
jgi:hypothetical protein